MITDNYEEPLPEWASGLAHNDYTKIGACLPTRDGRKVGNATVVSKRQSAFIKEEVYVVVTDAGNRMTLEYAELEEFFYPPIYTTNTPVFYQLSEMPELSEGSEVFSINELLLHNAGVIETMLTVKRNTPSPQTYSAIWIQKYANQLRERAKEEVR